MYNVLFMYISPGTSTSSTITWCGVLSILADLPADCWQSDSLILKVKPADIKHIDDIHSASHQQCFQLPSHHACMQYVHLPFPVVVVKVLILCIVVIVALVVHVARWVLWFFWLALGNLQRPHASHLGGVGVALLHGEGVHMVPKQPTCPLRKGNGELRPDWNYALPFYSECCRFGWEWVCVCMCLHTYCISSGFSVCPPTLKMASSAASSIARSISSSFIRSPEMALCSSGAASSSMLLRPAWDGEGGGHSGERHRPKQS